MVSQHRQRSDRWWEGWAGSLGLSGPGVGVQQCELCTPVGWALRVSGSWWRWALSLLQGRAVQGWPHSVLWGFCHWYPLFLLQDSAASAACVGAAVPGRWWDFCYDCTASDGHLLPCSSHKWVVRCFVCCPENWGWRVCQSRTPVLHCSLRLVCFSLACTMGECENPPMLIRKGFVETWQSPRSISSTVIYGRFFLVLVHQ